MIRFASSLLTFTIALAVPALAQDAQTTSVVDFALSHPADNASVDQLPILGDSVPLSVELRPIEGKPNYGYFYYAGQPVIVDMRTRAIVKIIQ